MPSLKDIAKHAKVSSCTVSRYLNKDIVIKQETAHRIEQAIKELGYVPNVVAKALKNNRTANIAVILPKINNLYYSEMTAGISEVLVQQQYNLFIYEVETLQMAEADILQMMRENMVAGVIFIGMSYDLSFRDSLQQLLEWEIPVVYMNRWLPPTGFPLLYPDFAKAGELAAAHFRAQGRKRVALLHKHQRQELLDAYRASFRAAYDGEEPLVLKISDDEQFSETCMAALQEHQIDAVFVLNEMYAVKLTQKLGKRKRRVPEDIAVLSFGSSLMSELSMPELSCIDLQNRKLGNLGAELILRQIHKEEVAPATVVEPCLIIREST